jgi:hypothetical protein
MEHNYKIRRWYRSDVLKLVNILYIMVKLFTDNEVPKGSIIRRVI